ncbi:hypothetical protein C922_03362 [Plasmodium inui San Antonio 1]|uniref:Uncharacterized protein n=1 Tax=Plasmodium inui San Antonio 1 TaxID=1237626 RepID=W6ZZ52_9APIC|nr:hypothetical protein C922_03362 [Plasmodium inui San Antonio 1]EUD66167.1 hypothetical protein C922_03362 [Plasmodium inui San Antonio 1]
MDAPLEANLYDASSVKECHNRNRPDRNNPDSSDDGACDDEETDAEATVVNKEGSFYKKLYALIESKSTYINLVLKCRAEGDSENATAQKKRYLRASRKSQDEGQAERESALETVREIIKRKFPKRAEGKIELYLKEIIGNPPPENCALHKTLYQRNGAKLFVKHNLISYLLHFVDNKTLMKLKECSKIDNEVVSLYLRKILHTLSFKDDEIKANIHYWRNVVNYFFCKTGTLKPVDRRNYQPVTKEFEKNKSFCVITEDSMDSKVYISLDYFNEKQITSCTHKNPLPHTCDVMNVPNGVEVLLKSENISIIDFVEEYYKRLIVHEDELMWHICNFRKSRKFLTLLFLEYLKCMLHVLEKYNGNCVFKKTEYLVNCGHHITHRIWIQMFYDYGYETVGNRKEEKGDMNRGQRTTGGFPKQDSTKQKNQVQTDSTMNKTLYLTIADHFKWDA